MRIFTLLGVAATALVLLAGCGGDDDTTDADANPSAEPAMTTEPADAGDAGGGSGGTLTVDGESIALSSARCSLEPQDSAGGGGQILFTGQGFGQNAAGDDVLIDVSRYDEASMFAGDSISMTVGDPTSPDSTTYDVSREQNVIVVDGSTLSGEAITLNNVEDGAPGPTVSFELNC